MERNAVKRAIKTETDTRIEEDGGDKRLVQLELAREADGVAPPDPV